MASGPTMLKMTKEEMRAFKHNLRSILCNQLTFPKVAASIAKERPLTEEEVAKINDCLERAVGLVEAELTIMLWKLTDMYID